MKPYRLQLFQAWSLQDRNLVTRFCVNFQEKLQENGFAEKVFFLMRPTFHVSGKVNRHNVRVWGTQNAHGYVEHGRDFPKVTVFCAVSASKVYGPFFLLSKLLRE